MDSSYGTPRSFSTHYSRLRVRASAPGFHAPPLVVANLAVYALLAASATLLLAFAVRAIFHARTRIVAAGAAIALIVAMIAYALEISRIVTAYTFSAKGFPASLDLPQLPSATIFFVPFREPTVFAAVALVILKRYRSVRPSSPAFIGFTCAAWFIIVVMTVFITASTGVSASAQAEMTKATIRTIDFARRLIIANNLLYVLTAFQVLSTIFLGISAFLVKTRTKGDQIISLTLFVVTPLLSLYSLARVIFDILAVTLQPSFRSKTAIPSNSLLAFDFSRTVIYGVLHTAIMSVLVFCVSRTRLWGSQHAETEGVPLRQGKHGLAEDTPKT